jgi:hypothetical protein
MSGLRHGFRLVRYELLICSLLNLAALFAAALLFVNNRPAQEVGFTRGVVLALSVLTPVALASSLMAADIEAGTVGFAWSIAMSRTRWFTETILVGLCELAVAILPLLIAAHLLGVGLTPQIDAELSPLSLDPCPLLLLARTVAIFAMMLLIAAKTGRIMATVTAGVAASLLLLAIIESVFGVWRSQTASPYDLSVAGSWPTGTAVVAFDGHKVSREEADRALAMGPEFWERYYLVAVGLSPADRSLLVAGETLVLGVVSLGTLVIANRIIEDRVVA